MEALPCILVNSIWWERNNIIFQNKRIPPEIITAQVINLSREFQVKKKQKKNQIPIMLKLEQGIVWGFFNGAIHGHP